MPVTDVVQSLLATFAASTATCMAYVVLPDYRYRNNISEYLAHRVLHHVHNGKDGAFGDINDKNVDQHSIWQLLSNAKERQQNSGGIGKVEYWLDFLIEIQKMPRGHVPNEDIYCPPKNGKERHWLQTMPGWSFRKFYMKHWDNIVIYILAAVALIFTGITQYATIYSPSGNTASGIQQWIIDYKTLLFITGGLGIVVPIWFAFWGRVVICKSARNAITIAVTSLMDSEAVAQIENLKKETDDL